MKIRFDDLATRLRECADRQPRSEAIYELKNICAEAALRCYKADRAKLPGFNFEMPAVTTLMGDMGPWWGVWLKFAMNYAEANDIYPGVSVGGGVVKGDDSGMTIHWPPENFPMGARQYATVMDHLDERAKKAQRGGARTGAGKKTKTPTLSGRDIERLWELAGYNGGRLNIAEAAAEICKSEEVIKLCWDAERKRKERQAQKEAGAKGKLAKKILLKK